MREMSSLTQYLRIVRIIITEIIREEVIKLIELPVTIEASATPEISRGVEFPRNSVRMYIKIQRAKLEISFPLIVGYSSVGERGQI